MHTGNVVVAWTFMVQDRLREEMRRLEVEQRDLATLTLVGAYEDCSQDWLRARIQLTQSGTVRLPRPPPPRPGAAGARGAPSPGSRRAGFWGAAGGRGAGCRYV